jgi:transposase
MSREGLRAREVTDEEGNRLLRIVRRSSGSVVTWRRAQMVLLSLQAMDVLGIAKVTLTSPDRVREVINNFNRDGFGSLYPKYAGDRPTTFALPQRQQVKKVALSRPQDHGLPFSTWSLAKLADFLVAEGVVDDISHEGLRELLQREDVSFQAVKTSKHSDDPDYEAKKNRVLELYDIAEGKAKPGPGRPDRGVLGGRVRPSQPATPARQAVSTRRAPQVKGLHQGASQAEAPRHLQAHQGGAPQFGALDMNTETLYGYIKKDKKRATFLAFCRYLRSLYPPRVRIAIVADNFSPHLSTKRDGRVGDWAAANNVELAYVPTNAPYLNRIECHFTALRYFALNGTDHRSHEEQNSMIRRYFAWRNRNKHNDELRAMSLHAKVA